MITFIDEITKRFAGIVGKIANNSEVYSLVHILLEYFPRKAC